MSSRPPPIPVVEDDPNQQDLTQMTLRHIGVTDSIHCVDSGVAVIAYLQGEGRTLIAFSSYLTLIITGVQMPEATATHY